MYLVEVPHRLPPARYPHTTSDFDAFLQRLRLDLLRGGRFPMTVTGLEATGPRPIAEGLLMQAHSRVRIALTEQQRDELGLPAGEYYVEGSLRTADDTPVDLPAVETLRVPTRWLHPVTDDRPPTHRQIGMHGW